MKAHTKTHLTPAEYLALERASEWKSEYVDGEMVEMQGASRYHNVIVTNLVYALRHQLKGRPYELYPGHMRAWVPGPRPANMLYTYPDIIVTSNDPQLADGHFDTLLNPIVIIEVLSPSTAAFDRGLKRQRSSTLPSLREYLLISQDRPRIEQFSRTDPESPWLSSIETSFAARAILPSIQCQLALSEVYEQVRFED